MTDQLIRRVNAASAAARGLQVRAATATTTVTQSQNRAVVHEEEKHHTLPDVATNDKQLVGFVEAGAGVTINTGDFSSLRLDCRVQLPFVYTDEGSIDAAYHQAMAVVANQLAAEQQTWVGRIEQRRGSPATAPRSVRATPAPAPVVRRVAVRRPV